jgi:hypothetical protein
MLPSVEERVTEAPPALRLLPLASSACTVMADIDTPLATIDTGLAAIVVVVGLAAPAIIV